MSAPPNSRPVRVSESGNAFFIVMIGVVLFAALMFTFSRGARQGGDNLSVKQAEIAATELIDLAQRYERAVSRLRLKGCSENQISFDGHNDALLRQNGTAIDFSNPNAPADLSCHTFAGAGGGLVPYLLPAAYMVDNSLPCATCTNVQSMYFTTTRIAGIGRDSGAEGSELTLWLGRVSRPVCIAINEQLGVPNPGGNPPVDDWECNSDQPFKGSFENCTDAVGDEATDLAGRNSFCVDFNNNGWTYIFMTVLAAR